MKRQRTAWSSMSEKNRNVEQERHREAQRWFALADEDVRVARSCAAMEPPALSSAAFHTQQAAEKVLKGLLVLAEVRFRKTHDMNELAGLAAPVYPELRADIDATRPLTVWGVAFRYPSLEDIEDPVPDVDTLEAMLTTISRLSEAMRKRHPA